MLAQKLVLSYYSKIFSQIIQIAVSIVVARVAGPTVLGTVAFGLAFVNMFKFIADLGIGSAHVKLISEGRDEAACIGTFAKMKIFFIGFFFIVVLGIFLIHKYIFHYNFESITHEKVILVLLISLTIKLIFSIPKTTFAAKTEQAKQDIPDLIQLIVYQSMRLVVVLLGYRALAIAFSNLAAAILMVPIYFSLFKDYRIGKFDKELAKQYVKIALPLIVVLISQTFIYWTDKVILQYLTSSEEVGYYVAGFRIGGFILMIGQSVGLLFFPLFSKAIAEKLYGKINLNIKKFEKFSLAFVFPVTVFASIYSDLVVKFILGAQYVKSIPILSIITLSMFIMIFFQPYGNVITGKGLFKLSAKLRFTQLIFFIIIAFALVSPTMFNLKGIGIAMSLLLSNLYIGILFLIYSKKNLKQLNILPSRTILIFGVLYSLISYILYNNILENLIQKIVFLPLYFLGYWGVAFFFGIIKKEEWAMLGNLVSIRKMKKYVKSEVKIKR